jgi:hypothetical protein
MCVTRPRQKAAQRREIDDPAMPAPPQQGSRHLRAQKLRLQIRIEDAVPLLFGQFLEFRWEENSRVVNQNIQPPEFLFDRIEERNDVPPHRHIPLHGQDTPSGILNLRGNLLGVRLRVAIIDDNVRGRCAFRLR